MAVVMAACLLPAAAVPASAASWMDPYLEKLVSWGIMRGDSSGNLHPNRDITRAEFVVLVNRAFGYDKTGAVPFKDVNPSDWYYDDICIGYNTGYFKGTTDTTASPRKPVTREQATVLLGRSLMLDDDPGASMDFTDSNSLGTWSRGIIRSAVAEKIVSGYADGSFRPKQNITRGQMAVLLVKAIGTPISTPGTYSLGGVYGNVTVSSSDVTLRDTTIAGNLYITGGLGLGSVNLENVTVLGKIVVAGAGESNKGENSIQLRNVTTPNLIMDSLANQFVTVRADGDTKIDNASIRTSAYLEDATDNSHGFTKIELDGENGTALDLAGNIKEVINLTPQSTVRVTKGTTKVLTVDEAAIGSAVDVARNAVTGTLNLDVGTKVTGSGDVTNLNVNAAGSSATLLPDKVTVRPGLDANVGGAKLDATLAAEYSADPRLLSGYPKITNLNPTSATAVFRANKSGTLYWALTPITDGSVNEDALLNPASRASIVKSGNIKVTSSNTDFNAALTGLTPDGSYYVSAMLVDARGQRSSVKVVSFSTPDNTTPNFASGYPYLSKITNNAAQVAVMPNKTCRLYYALLPKGATAPTAKDFRANAVPGNYGFGTLDVTKNEARLFYVNSKQLTELASYDLYLWLTDEDGSRSSAVKKLPFTTVDKTPPKFVTEPIVTSIKETSVTMTASINESGTIFWAAVKEGEDYPKPINGQVVKPTLDSDAAKLQVVNGMNALKSGKVTATANKDVTINISGLTSEGAYDVYYLIQDKAGNYSVKVEKLTIHTLDTNPPAISQEFTKTNDAAGKSPLADTDVRIIFSESVQDTSSGERLLELYEAAKNGDTEAKDHLKTCLENDIQLFDANVVTSNPAPLGEDVIKYDNVEITSEDGKVIVTFMNGRNLNLASGGKYYFQIQNIADTSGNRNIIKPNPTKLEPFTTVFAQIQFSTTDMNTALEEGVTGAGGTSVKGKEYFDMYFRSVPVATEHAGASVCWDMSFRMNIPAKFELYEKTGENGTWVRKGTAEINSTDGTLQGTSYTRNFVGENSSSSTNVKPLNEFTGTHYYGIRFTSLNNIEDRGTWSDHVEMQIEAMASTSQSALHNLAVSNMTNEDLNTAIEDGVVQIGSPTPFKLKHTFQDSTIPEFQLGYPRITPSDTSGSIDVQLTRTTGIIYYVIAPVETIATELTTALGTGDRASTSLTAYVKSESNETGNWNYLPATTTTDRSKLAFSSVPTSGNIMTPPYTDPSIIKGKISYYGSNVSIPLKGLKPETQYVAYFVLQGSASTVYSKNPYVFGFETTEVSRPIIELTISNLTVMVKVDSTSTVDYLLAVNGNEPGHLRDAMVNYVAEADKAKFQTGGDYYEKGTGKSKEYTVLDAMSNSYYKGGKLIGSVFDQFATPKAKEDFAEFIRSQTTTSGDVALSGTIEEILAGRSKTVDCSGGMVGTTWYTFLAVGRSATGSGDAFRAIRPVYNKDQSPPMVTACLYEIELNDDGKTYSGTVSLTFNEDLYWVEKDANTQNQTVTPISASSRLTPTSGYYPAGLAFSSSSPTFIVMNGTVVNQPTSFIRFQFSNAKQGSYIQAPTNLGDKAGSVHSVPLTVSFDLSNPASPKFIIHPEWDATGGR